MHDQHNQVESFAGATDMPYVEESLAELVSGSLLSLHRLSFVMT